MRGLPTRQRAEPNYPNWADFWAERPTCSWCCWVWVGGEKARQFRIKRIHRLCPDHRHHEAAPMARPRKKAA